MILPVFQCKLSTARHAKRIVVMAQGRIVDSGTHEALLAKQQDIYAHLWRMQDGGLLVDGAAQPIAVIAVIAVAKTESAVAAIPIAAS